MRMQHAIVMDVNSICVTLDLCVYVAPVLQQHRVVDRLLSGQLWLILIKSYYPSRFISNTNVPF